MPVMILFTISHIYVQCHVGFVNEWGQPLSYYSESRLMLSAA